MYPERLSQKVPLPQKSSKSRNLRNLNKNGWKRRCMNSSLEKDLKKLIRKKRVIGYPEVIQN